MIIFVDFCIEGLYRESAIIYLNDLLRWRERVFSIFRPSLDGHILRIRVIK